ncbi:MAG: Npt1/Npt2 family nucleotide transporter [Deltaproteobacteria bacterium]|nr:Npt1/Npt2 family nucleotide transporter [Deltaproteobacteria bacterium]
MRAWVLDALQIREGELRRVLSLALYLVLAVSTFITGRIARDALFLTVFQKEDLAYMYISVAVMVPIPAYLFARVADRFRRDKLLVMTLLGTVVCMGGVRVLLFSKHSWVYILLYNFVEIYGTFLILQFWTFAGDLFSSREAKRLFPIVSAGSVLAGIVCGLAVSGLVRAVGTENLLLLQMVLLSLAAIVIARLGHAERGRLRDAIVKQQVSPRHKKQTQFGVTSQTKGVFQSKHLRIIAGMTVATFVTVPLIDYQFKVLVKEHFTAGSVVDTDAMSAFMGLFSAATGIIAAVMQLGFTGRILERFGVVFSLLLLPFTLLLGLFSMLGGVLQAFYAAVFTKGAENSFRYSIYDATMQVLYTPVPSNVRGRAKTFIDGIIKPVAGGLAGAVMVLLVGPMHVPVTSLGIVAVGLVGCWIVLIFRMRGEYVKELLATLRKRKLDFSDKNLVINDVEAVNVLRARLNSPDDSEVRNAIELCRRVQGHDLSPELARLLTHHTPDLRIGALEILGDRQLAVDLELIEARFKDDNDDVRAAAIRAFCALVGEPAVAIIEPHLKAASPAVRGAAVASIIRHGGLEGILHAADDLKAMLSSQDEDVRFACARVLQEVGFQRFYAPAQKLLADESPRVRSAAIAAAGAMRSPELVPTLIYKLRDRDTMRAAQMALSQYGDDVIETLATVLSQTKEDAVLRRQVPRILERIGTRRALETLVHCLNVDDGETRKEVARATSRLRERLGITIDEARVKKLVVAEVHRHYQLLAMVFDLRELADDPRDLLRDALEERQRKSLDRIFRFLATVHPPKAIETIWGNLTSSAPALRANAVEVLDNLLDADDKRRLLPIVEAVGERSLDNTVRNRSLERVLERGTELYTLERKKPEEWLQDLLRGDDEWLCVCALHVVRELGHRRLIDDVAAHVRSRSAVVRETALVTLSVLDAPPTFLKRCAGLEDDDLRVQRCLVHLRVIAEKALAAA